MNVNLSSRSKCSYSDRTLCSATINNLRDKIFLQFRSLHPRKKASAEELQALHFARICPISSNRRTATTHHLCFTSPIYLTPISAATLSRRRVMARLSSCLAPARNLLVFLFTKRVHVPRVQGNLARTTWKMISLCQMK